MLSDIISTLRIMPVYSSRQIVTMTLKPGLEKKLVLLGF